MGAQKGWVDTIKVSETNHVRFVRIKKRPLNQRQEHKGYDTWKNKYELVCLVGANEFMFINLSESNIGARFNKAKMSNKRFDGRVLQVVNDRDLHFGVLVLSDRQKFEHKDDYYMLGSSNCFVYNFPLQVN